MDVVKIREARIEDCAEILRLIIELAVYENMEDQVRITTQGFLSTTRAGVQPAVPVIIAINGQELEENLSSSTKHFNCYVAEEPGSEGLKLVGYVLYFYHYSTWEGKVPYMEDFYVSPDYRGKGIGNSLLKCVVKEALEKNCQRLDFNTRNWNKSSIEYYKRKGAVDLTEKEGWHLFRMTPPDMKKFLGTPY